MNYIELECIIEPFDPVVSEILVAELGELGFESFVEQENGVLAYIRSNQYKAGMEKDLNILSNKDFKIEIRYREIQEENWNETWEKNYFEPIVIAKQCVVRSSFHPEFPEIKYQITIDPKMAFGTGHHQTTSLIVQEILEMDFEGKKVADIGCGTGILAILASMKGAKDITAIDTDEWSYRNTLENIELNNCPDIKVMHGNVQLLKNETFGILFANINKNVLLAEMEFYSKCMNKNSIILLSGFYGSDFLDIDTECRKNQLELLKQQSQNSWMMLKYQKI